MSRSGSELMQPVETTPEQDAWNLGMLNPKQRSFAEAIVADPSFDASAAARKAGYSNPSMMGARLIKDPKVAQLIGRSIHLRSMENKVTADRVLREMACLGFQNAKRYVHQDGTPRELIELSDEEAAAVKDLTVTVTFEENGEESVLRHVKYRYSFWSKEVALENLAKHVGILRDNPTAVSFVSVNWHELYQAIGELAKRPDPVEDRIAGVRQVINHQEKAVQP